MSGILVRWALGLGGAIAWRRRSIVLGIGTLHEIGEWFTGGYLFFEWEIRGVYLYRAVPLRYLFSV